MISHKPDGSPDLLPFLVVKDPQSTLDFAAEVFDGHPVSPILRRANGQIWNVELAIGDSRAMLSGAEGDFKVPGFLYVYVEDAERVYERALAAGAEPVMPVEDRFYGIRDGGVRDGNGTLWWIGTRTEDVPEGELHERAAREEAERVKS